MHGVADAVRWRCAQDSNRIHYRMSIELILVVPGLLALQGAALAAAPSLASLARFAPTPDIEPHGIAAALCAALGVRPATPVAPLAALGAGIDIGDDYMLCADPVHLVADRDDVVLLQRVDDLSDAAAHALAAALDRHFADDDVRFALARPDAWFAQCRKAPDLVTTPLDAALRSGLFPHLPGGGDAGTWKRWQNEIEMLLHEHPVNVVREVGGLAVANGIWFWGGGRLADVGPLPAAAVVASPGHVGDIARGIAQHGQGTAARLQADDDATTAVASAAALAQLGGAHRAVAIAVLPAVDGPDSVASLETRWLSPALQCLAGNRIDALRMIADGNGAAATWIVHPLTLWRRIVARARPRPFAVPASPAS